jgi:cbb3-type cytochrome oxidase maturation protein
MPAGHHPRPHATCVIALLLGAVFAVMFVSAAVRGQFDDLDDPPQRMLRD